MNSPIIIFVAKLPTTKLYNSEIILKFLMDNSELLKNNFDIELKFITNTNYKKYIKDGINRSPAMIIKNCKYKFQGVESIIAELKRLLTEKKSSGYSSTYQKPVYTGYQNLTGGDDLSVNHGEISAKKLSSFCAQYKYGNKPPETEDLENQKKKYLDAPYMSANIKPEREIRKNESKEAMTEVKIPIAPRKQHLSTHKTYSNYLAHRKDKPPSIEEIRMGAYLKDKTDNEEWA